jgi:glycerol-3-phosphate dehydrogenase (NAD(P)+)
MKAAVLGAGSWGTTYAKVLVDAGNEVTLWSRGSRIADRVDREHVNPDYLPDIDLPEQLHATDDAAAALDGAELVAIAVPSQTLRDNLRGWVDLLPRDAALEIARQQPTATVVACTDEDTATAVQQASTTSYFRPYTNTDVIGCELGGAVKNVIALACGIAQGMGLGDNTFATLITRGLAETARLGAALGADPLTFAGLAGMGDLVATCASPLSRNRTFGERLGRGDTLQDAQAAAHGQVAEGVMSCRAVLDLAHRSVVEVPITAAVEAVCFRSLSPRTVGELLMSRSTKSESH